VTIQLLLFQDRIEDLIDFGGEISVRSPPAISISGVGGYPPAIFISHLCRRHRQPSIIIITFLSPLALSAPSEISRGLIFWASL